MIQIESTKNSTLAEIKSRISEAIQSSINGIFDAVTKEDFELYSHNEIDSDLFDFRFEIEEFLANKIEKNFEAEYTLAITQEFDNEIKNNVARAA